MSREIKKIYANKEQDEGVGARVRRSIGGFEVLTGIFQASLPSNLTWILF